LLSGGHRPDLEAMAAIVADDAGDAESIAAQYVAAFDLGVPPTASAFLEPDGRVGGSVTTAIADAIARDGLVPATDEVGACHLGVVLHHAARLCAGGRDRAATAFLRAHALTWVPALDGAVAALGVPPWAAVVRTALEAIVDHVGAREPNRAVSPAPVEAGHPLLDPASGLRDVAAWLACPARCGLFLTDAECSRIGRALDLPRGFSHRCARIETLLRSAAQYATMDRLCDALDGVAGRRLDHLAALAEDRFVAAALSPWTTKLAATRRMLDVLRAGAVSVAHDGGPQR
jgi:nitrate reductase assembly molybdenum cofactor insertion protein NarJ